MSYELQNKKVVSYYRYPANIKQDWYVGYYKLKYNRHLGEYEFTYLVPFLGMNDPSYDSREEAKEAAKEAAQKNEYLYVPDRYNYSTYEDFINKTFNLDGESDNNFDGTLDCNPPDGHNPISWVKIR